MLKILLREQNELVLILLLAAVLFFSNIWGYDLWAPDEPRFAEISREMIEEGNWVVPHDNGWVYTDKPPLLFWLISIFSIIFGGVSSFTARLPSVLSGLGAVTVTYIIALRFFGKRTAFLSSMILITSYLFFAKARIAQTDMLLTFLILLCFLFFYLSQGELMVRRKALLLFYVALALATLTKGPVGFIIPLGVILLYCASVGEFKRAKEIFLFEGMLLFAVIVLGWVGAATIAGKGEYSVFSALNRHVIERFSEGLHHKQPFYYFLRTFPLDFLPWSLFIPASLAFLFSRLKGVERKEAVFLLCWFVFVFIFFSFSREKRNLYILPLFPAASIMVGHLFSQLIHENSASVPGRLASAFNYFLSGLFLVLGFFIPAAAWVRARDYFFPASILGALIIISAFFIFRITLKQGWLKGTVFSYCPLFFATGTILPIGAIIFYPDFIFSVLLMGIILVAGSVFLLLENRKEFSIRIVVIIILTISSFYMTAVSFAYPVLNHYKSARNFSVSVASTVSDYLGEGERLPIYKTYRSTYGFYSGLYLEIIPTEGELEKLFSSHERKFCLINQCDLRDISGKLNAPIYTMHFENIGHRSMILISNKP